MVSETTDSNALFLECLEFRQTERICISQRRYLGFPLSVDCIIPSTSCCMTASVCFNSIYYVCYPQISRDLLIAYNVIYLMYVYTCISIMSLCKRVPRCNHSKYTLNIKVINIISVWNNIIAGYKYHLILFYIINNLWYHKLRSANELQDFLKRIWIRERAKRKKNKAQPKYITRCT